MLTITIEGGDLFDDRDGSFTPVKGQILQLEHSLVSLSKWESKWHKPYLDKQEKTIEEDIDYIRCMTITQNVDPRIYNFLSPENIQMIREYIQDPMTATKITNHSKGKKNNEILTSELIYCYMISLNIPKEMEKWHLNRLVTLIEVCSIKSQPPKKMGRREALSQQAAINAARRKQLNTKG